MQQLWCGEAFEWQVASCIPGLVGAGCIWLEKVQDQRWPFQTHLKFPLASVTANAPLKAAQ